MAKWCSHWYKRISRQDATPVDMYILRHGVDGLPDISIGIDTSLTENRQTTQKTADWIAAALNKAEQEKESG